LAHSPGSGLGTVTPPACPARVAPPAARMRAVRSPYSLSVSLLLVRTPVDLRPPIPSASALNAADRPLPGARHWLRLWHLAQCLVPRVAPHRWSGAIQTESLTPSLPNDEQTARVREGFTNGLSHRVARTGNGLVGCWRIVNWRGEASLSMVGIQRAWHRRGWVIPSSGRYPPGRCDGRGCMGRKEGHTGRVRTTFGHVLISAGWRHRHYAARARIGALLPIVDGASGKRRRNAMVALENGLTFPQKTA
jgi:hypothetical protein